MDNNNNDWVDVPLNNQEDDWQDIPVGPSLLDRTFGAIKASTQPAVNTLKGFTEGVTMSGQDELGGITQGALDLGMALTHRMGLTGPSPSQVGEQLKEQGFTGDIGPTTTGEVYREGQKETLADFEKARAENPLLYTAGQLGGAVTTGMAAAPILAGAGSAMAATRVGQAAQSLPGISQAATWMQGAGKLPTIARNATKMAALGAPEGAVAGFLGSEANVAGEDANLSQVAGDVAGGALTGSLLGAGMSVASDVIPMAAKGLAKKADSWTDDSNFLRQLKQTYERGRDKGISYGSEKQALRGEPGKFGPLNLEDVDSSKKLFGEMESADKSLGRIIGKTIDDAQKAGQQIVLDDNILQKAQNIKEIMAENPLFGRSKAIKTFERMSPNSPTMGPRDLKNSIDDLDEVISILSRDTRSEVGMATRDIISLRNSLDQALKSNLPEYRAAAQRFYEFRSKLPETFIRGETPQELTDKIYGGLKNKESELFGKIRGTIANATKGGGAVESKTIHANLLKNVEELARIESDKIAKGVIKPGEDIFSLMGTTPDKFLSDFGKAADISAARSSAQGTALTAEGADIVKESIGIPAMVGQGGVVRAAGWAGRRVADVKGMGNKLYSMGPEQLMGVVEKLAKNPAHSVKARALQDAIANSDTAKKNAILFTIMQNPNLRLSLGDERDQSDQ